MHLYEHAHKLMLMASEHFVIGSLDLAGSAFLYHRYVPLLHFFLNNCGYLLMIKLRLQTGKQEDFEVNSCSSSQQPAQMCQMRSGMYIGIELAAQNLNRCGISLSATC